MLPAYRQLEKLMPAIYGWGNYFCCLQVCSSQHKFGSYIYSSRGFTGASVMNVCNFWDLYHFLYVHP